MVKQPPIWAVRKWQFNYICLKSHTQNPFSAMASSQFRAKNWKRYVIFLYKQLLPCRDANASETALSALPPHEMTCEIFEGQHPHRCFQNKKPKDSFNCLGQKRLSFISSVSNSTAVAVISSAHLDRLIHKGCPFVLKLFYANITKCTLSGCRYCS